MKKLHYTEKLQICRIAEYASKNLDKCHWWEIKKKKIYNQIIFEAYLDMTRG